MPDLFDLFFRWWKQILALVAISVVVAAVVVLLTPKKYLATATAVPASTYSTDKTGVFSQNLQSLYSALGTADDLDLVLGTAHLDTVYCAVADQLNLSPYYGISEGDTNAARKAACILKKRTRVIKSDYGELKVKVWDGDPKRAASFANSIMDKLQEIHQRIQTINNNILLSKITDEYAQKKLSYEKISDSLSHTVSQSTTDLLNVQKSSVLQQMLEYEKLLDQYRLMVNARPQALIIVERATPPLNADRPRTIEVIVGAAVLSLFFALLAALALERRMEKNADRKKL
jgi:capsular polysaccharide biosynthesis protein